jgi:hypothetical protein
MAGSISNFPLGIVGYNRTIIEGTFFPNGSSAVANTSNKGKGWTVARTSQGLFTITLVDKPVAQIDFAIATLQLASAAATLVQIGVVSPTAGTIQIRNIDTSAGVQDIAANANNAISFMIIVRSGAEL